MAGLTINTKKRAWPEWPEGVRSFEPYNGAYQYDLYYIHCPGFVGDTRTSIRIPYTGVSTALQYYDANGTASTAGAWNGGLTVGEGYTDADYWVGWYMDASDNLLYLLSLDHGTNPNSLCLSSVNSSGTVTEIGKTAFTNAVFNYIHQTNSYLGPLYRPSGDGSGDFAISFSNTAGGNAAAGAPCRGVLITIGASDCALSYSNLLPSTFSAATATGGGFRFGPTSNNIIGGPYGAMPTTWSGADGQGYWYGGLMNTSTGKGHANAIYKLPFHWATTIQPFHWREHYIMGVAAYLYGPQIFSVESVHSYLDEMAIYYGIL